MSILTKLGIIKEAIGKLLSAHQTIPKPKQKPKRKVGRPINRHIDQSVVDAVRKASKTLTLQELSTRYGVSKSWIRDVRIKKIRIK